MTPSSSTHLVLIPSYNTGPKLVETVQAAVAHWNPVWVVVDGSTDGSAKPVLELAGRDPRLRVLVRDRNGGKGAAVATGVAAALAAGFTHVLTMDSDGQHPVDHIAPFMAASAAHPAALVLGRPLFGPEVPLERLQGRKLSVALARLEILGRGIDDPLFGFRVYPAAALHQVLTATRHARGFDFDPEVAVRLVWAGVPTVNLPAPCRYFRRSEGGVSHFHYVRDNLKLIWLHTRLLSQLLVRHWPHVWRQRTVLLVLLPALLLGAATAGFAADAAAPGPVAERFGDVILDPDHEPAWHELFARLGAPKARISQFEERRHFPFRSQPVVLKGEIRLSPAHGLSLHYYGPREHIVIVDQAGVLLRDERGRSRAAPDDDRARTASAGLFTVLRFDLPALVRQFEIRGRRTGDEWTLGFTPREAQLAGLLGTVAVHGRDAQVTRIEMIRSDTQRIDILITQTLEDVIFPPDVLREYFR